MIELVTDRTREDVIHGNAKGVYSYTDLNRVESAVSELFELANDMGYNFTPTVKTDWGEPGSFSPSEWPTASQMDRYLGNVKFLADVFLDSQAPLPSTMSRLSYVWANYIERCLETVYDTIQRLSSSCIYCGEIYAGDEIGI